MFDARALERQRRAKLDAAIARVPAARRAQWPVPEAELRAALTGFAGNLVFYDSPDYGPDRQGNSMYPFLASPELIAYCTTESDVAICLAVAQKYRGVLPFTMRCGGHSNAGYSVDGGMVIDMSAMNGVFVMPDQNMAIVGAGANLDTVYQALDRYGLHVPGGECGSVGVSGHSMGGGYGFTSRMFGLNCDRVVGARMMTADGKTVMANATSNPDLFWALRGGTGNQFGVLLALEYAVTPLPPIWACVVAWALDDAPAALVQIQTDFIHVFTSDMGYQLAIGRDATGTEKLYFMGMYNGTPAQGMAQIQPLLDNRGTLLKSQVGLYSQMNAWLLDWYDLPAPIETTMEVKQSNYIARALSVDEWGAIIEYYQTKPTQYDMVAFEVYGGAASSPGVQNAFIHRQVDMDMFIDSFSNSAWPTCGPAEADKWVAGFDELMQRFANGSKYQNYPNTNNADYRFNYWGDVYNSLLFVKQKYDPTGFFSFQQSITPYPPDPSIRRSTVPSRFSDPRIQYEPGQGA